MSKQISLTQGKFSIVDDADFDWLNQWKWCAIKQGNNKWYAIRSTPRDENGVQRMIRMHREILQPPMNMETDHKDGDGLNNQRNNLRNATRAQNQQNQRRGKRSSSRFKGACWRRGVGKWQVHITVKGKLLHLGYFSSEIEAAQAYDMAAQKYFGEFARTNFSRERHIA